MFWILLTGRTLILCFYFCSGKAFFERYEIADIIQLLRYCLSLLYYCCFLLSLSGKTSLLLYVFIYLFVCFFCSEKALFKSYLIADI